MLRALAVATLLALAPATAIAQTRALDALFINESYDPHADPYRDLDLAIDRAIAEDKRILIIVGGEWCGWCEIFERFLARDARVRAAFLDTFVMVKVNYSQTNRNIAFLSGFPASRGYPDFFVLDSNGAFLAQQPTDALERGDDYDRARMLAFAERWR